ncbi:MAG: DNA/RNA non-specific endonuclease [Candidatus Zixiibacteriota bacterium]
MKLSIGFSSLMLLAQIFASTATADYLEVSRSATIRSEPVSGSQILERVGAGTDLQLLDEGEQTKGYYHVLTVSQGLPGWIYRTFVRRYYGEIPIPVDDAEFTDPMVDKTCRLTTEQRQYALRHLSVGKPQAVYERVREGYVVGQDARLKIPLWVQYQLTRDDLYGTVAREEEADFRPDASIPYGYRAEPRDYEGSGFDQGHMAPAADMTRSNRVMSESFLLSNMAPQVGVNFNRHIWSYLESSVRGWVEQRGTLTIITGPVFEVISDGCTYRVIGDDHVAVPTHFFKIIVDANDPLNVEALAFLMPNEPIVDRDIGDFLTSIDELENLTGLDFLTALPTQVQQEVESEAAGQIW